ncbi:MAG: adenylate/guanylate cyclase domain-containing protein [Actinomycetes bacterium]
MGCNHDGGVGSCSVRIFRSFAFLDLSGFTALTASEGDEKAVALLSSFRTIVRDVCSRRGVRIDKWLGDGAMLVAVNPTAMLAALLEVEHAMKAAGASLQVRCGATGGEVILHEGDDYIGTPVNIAARLCDLAPGGEVLVTPELAAKRPPWASISAVRSVSIKGFDDQIDVVLLGLAAGEDDATSCPICTIPLTPDVAASTALDVVGAQVLFCSAECRETWERRPGPTSEEQGSLRSPLMGW